MDIENTFSIHETAKRLARSNKTIYRWIAQGKLPAVKVGMQYFVKQEDVESLASGLVAHEDTLVQRIDTLEQRIADLESQFHDLRVVYLSKLLETRESHQIAMSESPVPLVEDSRIDLSGKEKPVRIEAQSDTEASITWTVNTPEGTTASVDPPKRVRTQIGTLPEGHINYTQFYRDHGISSGVADRARGKNFFPVQVGNWHDERGHPVTLALDTLGMWNFCVYFKSTGRLRECSRQTCACHEV